MDDWGKRLYIASGIIFMLIITQLTINVYLRKEQKQLLQYKEEYININNEIDNLNQLIVTTKVINDEKITTEEKLNELKKKADDLKKEIDSYNTKIENLNRSING